jgi:hypothetical protein
MRRSVIGSFLTFQINVMPSSFETSKNHNPATYCHIADDLNPQDARCGNFKSRAANSKCFNNVANFKYLIKTLTNQH